MKRSPIKWKLFLFDESDFFSFEASLFFILFLHSHIVYSLANQETCIFFKKSNQIIKCSGLKRMYNLCIVKKAKLEISGSHRWEIGKGGGLGALPQNFKESKHPKGLSAMVSYVKKT